MKQKNKKIKLIDTLAISLIAILFILFAPKTFVTEEAGKVTTVYEEKKNFTEYPLEIKIDDNDKQKIMELLKVYSIGIEANNINLLDGISQNEMVEFCIATLSEQYASAENIPKTSVEKSMTKYFDMRDVNYEGIGYTEFKAYKNIKAKKVFNVTKVMQIEENSDSYFVYTDCVDSSKIHEETYKKEDIENVYIFTMNKIVEEKKDGNIVHSEIRYILQKVEKTNK